MNQQHNDLIRIVRLTLAPEKVNDFMEMFNAIRSKIRLTEGCKHLALLQDATFPNILTTYSIWTDESALNAYRSSNLFKNTWRETRTMFAAPPAAFSSFQLQVVD